MDFYSSLAVVLLLYATKRFCKGRYLFDCYHYLYHLMEEYKICNVDDYQIVARSIIPNALYEYLASGTDDEQTLAENVSVDGNR